MLPKCSTLLSIYCDRGYLTFCCMNNISYLKLKNHKRFRVLAQPVTTRKQTVDLRADFSLEMDSPGLNFILNPFLQSWSQTYVLGLSMISNSFYWHGALVLCTAGLPGPKIFKSPNLAISSFKKGQIIKNEKRQNKGQIFKENLLKQEKQI